MTHTYKITGMTCGGCVNKVKNELLKIAGVANAEVQLEAPQATITMQHPIAPTVLQQALGNGKYTITPMDAATPTKMEAASTESVSYYPILLIFGYITGITLLIQFANGTFSPMQWMSSFMAGFFLLFSMFKLLNLSAFADGYSTYDIIAKKWYGYGYVYPFIEVLLGIGYRTAYKPLITNIITLAVMGISTIGVAQSLFRKTTFNCACLGTIIKLPLSKVTLAEDLLMVTMSLAMILMLSGVL